MKQKRRVNQVPTRLSVNLIVINDRNVTAASAEVTQWIDGQMVTDQATGSAKRAPGDVRDDVIATELAVGRALVNLGRRLQDTSRILVGDAEVTREREAIRRVRRKLRQVRPDQLPEHMSLHKVHEEYGLEAVLKAAERRGVTYTPQASAAGRHEKTTT